MNRDTTGGGSVVMEAARILEAHADYRLLRRIEPRKQFNNLTGRPVRIGAIIDTETTGLSSAIDAVIELGIVKFEYDPETGKVFRVLDSLNEMEDPRMAIPPASTAVHGITDSMVAGKRINDARVETLLKDVNVAIAHNAGFDRVFLEKRLPIFSKVPWACSLTQIDWRTEGFGSAKLDYIGYQYGLFYEAHRAVADCVALLEILQMPLPKSGILAFKALLDEARQKTYQVYAEGAPFEAKDRLKARAYRWNADRKCWHKPVAGIVEKGKELEWLKEHVYQGRRTQFRIELLDSLTRFSKRAGKEMIVQV